MRFRAVPILMCIGFAAGCAHHRQEAERLHSVATQNRVRVGEVRLGASAAEVQALLGPPQSREAVRTARGDEEVWRYLIDYHRSLMTEVTFVNGSVVEIREVTSTAHHHD